MAHSQTVIKWFLQQNGLSEAEADTFSRLPWVRQMDEMKSAGTLPKNLPPLNEDTVKQFRRDARKAGVPFADFVQQKILPSSVKATPPGPAVDAGTAAAAAAAADIPQPIAPIPTTLGGAPQAPSPLGPLPPGTSIMEPPSGSLQSTPPPGFSGLDQPQIDLTPDAGMAGFAPVTPQSGGGLDPNTFLDPRTNPQAAGLAPGVAERYGTGHWPATIRLNNPAAVSLMSPNKGFAVDQPGFVGVTPRPKAEGGYYAKFATPEYGIAANAKLLATKYNGYTPAKLASTWAAVPGVDYAPKIAAALGIGVNDPIDTTDPENQIKILRASTGKESGFGKQVYTDEMLRRGVYRQFDEPFPTDVELQDAGVTPASWLSGGEYRPLGDGAPAPAPETPPTAPPPPAPSASDPFAGNVEPPPFTKGPTAAPPTPPPPTLGGGVGYDTLPPSADPSMLQRPLEPQLGPLKPPVLGAPVLGQGGDFMPPQGSSDTLGTAYGDPVLGGGMGGDLASGDGSLGPLIDPSMPLPTRAPTPPIVGMPMSLQGMTQAPLEPQLPTSPMSIPTRSTYSSNMSPIDQPPMSSFDPAAAPPLGAPSYDMANTFDPSMSQYDMANQFSPTQPPPATPQYDMANQFSPATPQYDMANQFSPASTPPATPQYDMANQFSPSTPQFDMANTFTPTPSGGPPGTVPSPTEPSTYVPPGFGVAGTAGFTPPPMGASGWPSIAGTPSFAGAPSSVPGLSTPNTTTPTAGFDPTQGAPGVGGVPAMPSWAIPGAFGMGPNMPLGGTEIGQFAGGTLVPTLMASSTGAYTGLGTNPATLGMSGMSSPMLGMVGPGPQPGGTDWSNRATGGIGGGPISEGTSPTPAGNAASSASMESHALQLMGAQDTANRINSDAMVDHMIRGTKYLPSPVSGAQVMGLVGSMQMPTSMAIRPPLPPIRPPDIIRPYGMNVGFNGPSFGSRF